MPQLVKGGKWVFGWAVVGPDGSLPIPPEAWDEYGFQAGEEAILIAGSRTSGGFGVSTFRLLNESPLGPHLENRALGRGEIGQDQRVMLPAEANVQEGDRLLVARGSGLALGFLVRGPIYAEALRHTNIDLFE